LLDPDGGLGVASVGGLSSAVRLPPAADLPSAAGFSPPLGDPEALLGASGLIDHVAGMLSQLGAHVHMTAGSLASTWTGEAAASYQALSSIISSHFQAAAATSETAAAQLRRYGAELERCQREGITALEQAERCLKEIKTESDRLQAAQSAGSAAHSALSAARAHATTARGAGPLGVVAAVAADAEAVVAQATLSNAQSDEQAASRALAHAQHELAMWQARGRAAWQDAQNAADQASGSLQALTIVPPPLAGAAAIAPLVPTAPFAVPGERCDAEPDEPDEPTIAGGLLPFTIPDEPPWIEDLPGREPSPGDGLLPHTIPGKPQSGEDLPADEPIPGGNTTNDPAESCGRQQVNDEGAGDKTPGAGQPDGEGDSKQSPALKGSPYSPGEVDRRRSELRRQLGTGTSDPDSPIPDQRPGENLGQSAQKASSHRTGERNVNPTEEHSRTPKGAPYYGP